MAVDSSRIRRPSGGSLLRRLFGKAGYFPVSPGPRQRFGTTRTPGDQIPEPHTSWQGTRPEWRLMYAHYLIGRRPTEEFFYQYDPFQDGTTQIDFYEVPENLGIEVQGFFFHVVGVDAFQTFRDFDRRIRLESIGLSMIFIDEFDIERDPVFYLREALAGRDHSRFARGVA